MTIVTSNTTLPENQLSIFNFENNQVRTIVDETGDIWWVAKDICSILGFADHISAMRNHLDEDEKGVLPQHTLGGVQDMVSVNESGLYTLIFKSSKPEARPFRKWVTSEVLPTIRKTGGYSAPTMPISIPGGITPALHDLEGVAVFFGAVGNQAKLSANMAVKKIYGIDCMSLVGVTHLIPEKQIQYFTPTVIGKPLGLSAYKTNQAIESAGLQTSERDHKNRIVWMVTEKGKDHCQLLDTNKKHSNGTPVMQIKWAESVVGLISELAVIA